MSGEKTTKYSHVMYLPRVVNMSTALENARQRVGVGLNIKSIASGKRNEEFKLLARAESQLVV